MIHVASTCQHSSRIYYDAKIVGRDGDARVSHRRIIEECRNVLSEDSKYWTEETRQRLLTAPYWSANKWIEVLAKGGGNKIRFQYCLKPDDPDSCTFEPFKVVQEKPIQEMLPSIQHCKTMYCYQRISPDMFVTPEAEKDLLRLIKSKNRALQKYLETMSGYRFFAAILMLAQEKELRFYQTRSHAVILYDTLPAECIEKAICMVTTETLH